MITHLSVEKLRDLGFTAFINSGVSPENAAQTVDALIDAELEGIASHGFSRIPFYLDQVRTGKVQGKATPTVTIPKPSAVMVDAGYGFSFPAINAGLKVAQAQAQKQGICGLGVTRSHHCGVLGLFVEHIAKAGFLGLAFSNTPEAMAPWGGKKACFGTNPIAFACPRKDASPLVIDLSLSKVARGKIMVAKQQGKDIPEGWALDTKGNPTTSPEAALAGTMVPLGDAKGAALALMVEVLAATLTGANHAYEASSFFDSQGPAPGIGQFFIIIDPVPFNSSFSQRFEDLCHAILNQDNTRLPGSRREEERQKRMRDGISLSTALMTDLHRRSRSSYNKAK